MTQIWQGIQKVLAIATGRAARYILITVAAAVALTPTVATWLNKDQTLPAWFKNAFPRKILLGLDLQGGLHIVYKVDVDKAIGHKADRLAGDVEDKLAKERKLAVPNVMITRVGQDEIDVRFKNPDDAKKLNRDFMKNFRRDLTDDTSEAKSGLVKLHINSDIVDELREYAVRQGVETIRNRVDKLAVAEPTIIRKGTDIIVELPGLRKEDFERVKRLIGQTAQLEFKIVDDSSEYMEKKILGIVQVKKDSYPGLEWEHDQWPGKGGEQTPHSDVYLKSKDRKIVEKFFAELPADDQVPADHEIGYEQVTRRDEEGAETGEKYWRTYYLHRRAQLTGEYVTEADVNTDPQTLRPEVSLTFDHRGAEIFEQVSGQNVGRKMAIILDEKISSAPVLESKIGGGHARITMGGGGSPEAIRQEAMDLVAVLKTGALPAPLDKKSETGVGATLGADSIAKAKLSMLVGSMLVIVFMLVYYRAAGLIANLAMVLNIFYLLAILAMLQATLTLPGIAGVVLTVGMAVDANIIIYERIREELRSGKSPRGAIEAGFGRAFWTVFDAHVTNLVAGIVLYSYGTGPIRGFAVTLMAGIVCNLFTSVWVSRAMFDLMVSRRKSATLSI